MTPSIYLRRGPRYWQRLDAGAWTDTPHHRDEPRSSVVRRYEAMGYAVVVVTAYAHAG